LRGNRTDDPVFFSGKYMVDRMHKGSLASTIFGQGMALERPWTTRRGSGRKLVGLQHGAPTERLDIVMCKTLSGKTDSHTAPVECSLAETQCDSDTFGIQIRIVVVSLLETELLHPVQQRAAGNVEVRRRLRLIPTMLFERRQLQVAFDRFEREAFVR
jgi:hypothetical protein